MRAAVYAGEGRVELREVRKPVPASGEILLRTLFCGICGSDVRIWRRGSPRVKPPLTLGHEFSGEVVEVGGQVTRFKVGDRVTSYPAIPCLRCIQCRRGAYNVCENIGGFGYDRDGGFADYILIPERTISIGGLVAIPENVTGEEATIVEPLACCLNGVMRVRIEPGDDVAIIGDGPIGLLHLQLARVRGASQVYVIGQRVNRLEVASQLGADAVINVDMEDPEDVKRLCGGGVEVVVVAVGVPEAVTLGLSLLKPGGRINIFGGMPPGTSMQLDPNRIHYSEITMSGSFSSTPEFFSRAMKLIAGGRVKARELITHKYPLPGISQALATSERMEGLRVLVYP